MDCPICGNKNVKVRYVGGTETAPEVIACDLCVGKKNKKVKRKIVKKTAKKKIIKKKTTKKK